MYLKYGILLQVLWNYKPVCNTYRTKGTVNPGTPSFFSQNRYHNYHYPISWKTTWKLLLPSSHCQSNPYSKSDYCSTKTTPLSCFHQIITCLRVGEIFQQIFLWNNVLTETCPSLRNNLWHEALTLNIYFKRYQFW